MEVLKAALEKECGIDELILDAASGIRDAYTIAADVCDEMLMFFRWTRQHVQGTLRVIHMLRLLEDYQERAPPYRLIASAVPTDDELGRLEDEALRNNLRYVKGLYLDLLRETLAEVGANPADVFHEIPELLEMKWQENIIVFDTDDSAYESLARKLVPQVDASHGE